MKATTKAKGLKTGNENELRRRNVPQAWVRAAGMWEKKKPDPLAHLKTLRKEW